MLDNFNNSTALRAADIHPSYSYPDGDLILLSKDGMQFQVHSQVLRLTSGVFREMLGIPRIQSEDTHDPIPMEENADVLEAVLDAIYPGYGSKHASMWSTIMKLAEPMIAAAEKYDMPSVSDMVRAYIFNVAHRPSSPADTNLHWSPLRKYRFACRYGWEHESKIASAETLQINLASPNAISELEKMNICDVLRLQALHRSRRMLFIEALTQTRLHCGSSTSKECSLRWGNIREPASYARCKCHTDNDMLPHTIATDLRWRIFLSLAAEELEDCPLGGALLDTFWEEDGPDCRAIMQLPYQKGGCCFCSGGYTVKKERFSLEIKRILSLLPTTISY